MTQEEQVHVPKVITQTRVRHQPVEQIVEATGLHLKTKALKPSTQSSLSPDLNPNP